MEGGAAGRRDGRPQRAAKKARRWRGRELLDLSRSSSWLSSRTAASIVGGRHHLSSPELEVSGGDVPSRGLLRAAGWTPARQARHPSIWLMPLPSPLRSSTARHVVAGRGPWRAGYPSTPLPLLCNVHAAPNDPSAAP